MLTTISSESFSSGTLHRTSLTEMSVSWNKDDRSISQYTALSILLYAQKGVYALRHVIFNLE